MIRFRLYSYSKKREQVFYGLLFFCHRALFCGAYGIIEYRAACGENGSRSDIRRNYNGKSGSRSQLGR